MIRYFIFILLLFACKQSYSQSLTVVFNNEEEEYRRAQLLGEHDSLVSFTIRPLIQGDWKVGSNMNIGKSIKNPLLRILPFSIQNQITSHHGFGWNDGPMIPSKGFQTYLSGGVFMEYKPLTIQFKPEFVYAQNSKFEEFPVDHYDIIWKWYYNYYNKIDLPVRFGNKPYGKLSLGQSSIRLNYKKLSFGVSSENLWWGPGIRSSLLMSNSAPGFLHFTLDTKQPVQTKIGSFEGQIIAGKLNNSNFTPPDSARYYLSTPLYEPKPNENRYLSGIIVTYHPKWVPGLFLGLARSSQNYTKNLKSFADYLPLFKTYNSYSVAEKLSSADNYTSMYMRWIWSKENMEIYAEFGRNDQSKSFSDFLKDPNYSRAYILGVRKLFSLNAENGENIMANVEITQVSQSSPFIVRNAGGWYTDENVRQGYTHEGQMLGSGLGPGGNLQSFGVSWLKKSKLIGLQIERYEHNKDFYYYAYEPSLDYRRNWVDLSIAVKTVWDYKNLLFNASLNYIHSFNYGWYVDPTITEPYFISGRDVNNIQANFGLTYKF